MTFSSLKNENQTFVWQNFLRFLELQECILLAPKRSYVEAGMMLFKCVWSVLNYKKRPQQCRTYFYEKFSILLRRKMNLNKTEQNCRLS